MPQDSKGYFNAASSTVEKEENFTSPQPDDEIEKQPLAIDAEWEELTMSLTPILEGIKSGK
jgi:hypothetical protein